MKKLALLAAVAAGILATAPAMADEALAKAKLPAHVAEVVEDKKRGLVARIATTGAVDDVALAGVLGQFPPAWERIA